MTGGVALLPRRNECSGHRGVPYLMYRRLSLSDEMTRCYSRRKVPNHHVFLRVFGGFKKASRTKWNTRLARLGVDWVHPKLARGYLAVSVWRALGAQ